MRRSRYSARSSSSYMYIQTTAKNRAESKGVCLVNPSIALSSSFPLLLLSFSAALFSPASTTSRSAPPRPKSGCTKATRAGRSVVLRDSLVVARPLSPLRCRGAIPLEQSWADRRRAQKRGESESVKSTGKGEREIGRRERKLVDPILNRSSQQLDKEEGV